MIRGRIETYLAGGAELSQSIWGLTHDQLHAKPADGSWTIHQIVIHMLESDLIGTDRMKRIACMDKPLLIGYDENGFINLPGVSELNPFLACDLFQKNRQMTATVLRRLPKTAWDRWGIHNESGKVTLTEMLEKYIHHLEHHLQFLARKRAALTSSPA
jgi:uncharacterized damage-inducible protein DinB